METEDLKKKKKTMIWTVELLASTIEWGNEIVVVS